MKRTLTREWTRVRTALGNLVYVCHINEFTLVNVYRDGSHWQYIVIGWPFPEHEMAHRPIILQHGSGQTKNEAQYYAESYLPSNGISGQGKLPW